MRRGVGCRGSPSERLMARLAGSGVTPANSARNFSNGYGCSRSSRGFTIMNYSGARFLATAAVVAAAALLAFVVAYWGTKALAPASVHIPPAAPGDPVATILASGLMRAPGT